MTGGEPSSSAAPSSSTAPRSPGAAGPGTPGAADPGTPGAADAGTPGAEARGSAVARQALIELQREYGSAGQVEPLEEYLEGMARTTRAYYEQDPRATPELIEAAIAAMDATSRSVYARLPSPYESIGTYSVLLELDERISSTAADMNFPLSALPTLGTMRTGSVNAVTARVPRTPEHLLILDSGLMNFALLVTKAVALSFPTTESDDQGRAGFSTDMADVMGRLDADPTIGMRFLDVVGAYSVDGDPARAQPYVLGGVHGRLAALMRSSMELFVIGHEYGHIIAGHLDDARESQDALRRSDMSALEYSWLQELEADTYGILLSVSAMRRYEEVDVAIGFVGADLFFSAMEIMDRSVSLLNTGDENQQRIGTHPPSAMRRQAIRATLAEAAPPELADSAIKLADVVIATLDQLWAFARPHIAALHQQGAVADPGWETVG